MLSITAILLLLGIGCTSAPVATLPDPIVSEPVPAPADPHAEWQTYNDSAYGFLVQYPGDAALDLATEQALLPDAVGEKSRSFQVLYPNVEELDVRGCVLSTQGTVAEPDFATKEGAIFCRTTASEGAAGSVYVTYHYVTILPDGPVDLAFTIRHVTDVHVYGGCEAEADLTKEFCVEHAFDEARDAALFQEIFATFKVVQK